MHFTASIHTGGHTPFSLHHAPVAIESKDISTRAQLDREWSVTASVNIDHSPVTVLQGFSEGVLLVRTACHVLTIMEMKKAHEKLKLERTMNGAKTVNAQGFDRTGAMVWIKLYT